MKYITILAAIVLSLGACTNKRAVKEEPFIVNLESPKIEVGKFDAQFDKTVSMMGLRYVEVTVSYYPVEDVVCLQYRIDLMTYYLFWSDIGRETYLKALEKYKEDFEQRNLKTRGSRNTRRNYGKADCYLIWQAGAFLKRSKASNVTEIGYDIKNIDKNNKASFFTLWQRESIYINEMENTERRNSLNIPIYLTRAKADELAEFFKQDLLKSLVPENIKKRNDLMLQDIL
jgi:hypothetical protein